MAEISDGRSGCAACVWRTLNVARLHFGESNCILPVGDTPGEWGQQIDQTLSPKRMARLPISLLYFISQGAIGPSANPQLVNLTIMGYRPHIERISCVNWKRISLRGLAGD